MLMSNSLFFFFNETNAFVKIKSPSFHGRMLSPAGTQPGQKFRFFKKRNRGGGETRFSRNDSKQGQAKKGCGQQFEWSGDCGGELFAHFLRRFLRDSWSFLRAKFELNNKKPFTVYSLTNFFKKLSYLTQKIN